MQSDKSIIKNLKKHKEFDKIYKLYGSKTYLNNVSWWYKKKDIKNLINEGRFLDLYEKYGENIYNSYLKKMQRKDVYNELGVKPGFNNYLFFHNLKQKLKVVKKGIFYLTIYTAAPAVTLSTAFQIEMDKNQKKYAQELEAYNESVKEYASYINSLGLNDLQIIVKVMDDMWKSISGYKSPDSYDEAGIMRLSVYMNGYGVCRNFADDMATRLNAINPSYNACMITSYIENAETNDIERKIIETNETVSNDEQAGEITDNYFTKLIGNHAVVCLYLKEKDLMLIVDPTNPSIGILKNGKIEMFSSLAKDGMEVASIGNILLSGSDGVESVLKSYITNEDYESIASQFNIEAQNDALKEIENYDNNYKTK